MFSAAIRSSFDAFESLPWSLRLEDITATVALTRGDNPRQAVERPEEELAPSEPYRNQLRVSDGRNFDTAARRD
jgi:hypothetical protein